MNKQIICKGQPNQVAFFLDYNGKRYFLFTQKYNRSVFNHFRNGVHISKMLEHHSNENKIYSKTIQRINMMVKYIEREYDIQVFKNSCKKLVRIHDLYDYEWDLCA